MMYQVIRQFKEEPEQPKLLAEFSDYLDANAFCQYRRQFLPALEELLLLDKKTKIYLKRFCSRREYLCSISLPD